jgi:hypothetical protein
VIIGDSLEALLLGYKMALPVISPSFTEPYFFETYEPSVDLSFLGIENIPRTLTSPSTETTVGVEKRIVYRRIASLMSLAGLLPFTGQAMAMRPAGENRVRVILDHARAANFTYESSIIVGQNLLKPKIPPDKYMVLDWINVRSGMIHPYDRIETTSDLARCIHFYPTHRIDGNHQSSKDAVAVSYLTRSEMDNYAFSDTYVRFRVLEEMKAAGIRGARNGRDVNRPGKYKYYAVKIETAKREAALPTEDSRPPEPCPPDTHLGYLTRRLA